MTSRAWDRKLTRKSAQISVSTVAVAGALLGAIGTIVLAGGAKIEPGLFWLVVVPFATVLGLVGGLLSALLAKWYIRVRGPGHFSRSSNAVLVATATLSAGTALYLVLFSWQAAQAPSLMVIGPALVLTLLMARMLGGALGSLHPVRPHAARRVAAGVFSLIAGVGLVLWLSLVVAPAGISDESFRDSFTRLEVGIQTDIVFRVVCLVVASTALTAVGLWRDSRDRTGLSDRAALLMAIFVPFAIAAVHLNWLSEPITGALVILHQSESPPSPLALVVQIAGWVIIVTSLAVTSVVLTKTPHRLSPAGE